MNLEEYSKLNKKPKKNYTFEEHRSNEDKQWRIDRQRRWDAKGNKIIKTISFKYSTRYQREQMSKKACN